MSIESHPSSIPHPVHAMDDATAALGFPTSGHAMNIAASLLGIQGGRITAKKGSADAAIRFYAGVLEDRRAGHDDDRPEAFIEPTGTNDGEGWTSGWIAEWFAAYALFDVLDLAFFERNPDRTDAEADAAALDLIRVAITAFDRNLAPRQGRSL